MAIVGSTVRLHGTFYNWDSVKADLDEPPKAYVFNTGGTRIDGPLSTVKVDTGIYRLQYIVPAGEGNLLCEFKGTMEGSPAVANGLISRSRY